VSNPTSDVTQLILRERQCHDCGWYDQMRECFIVDSVVDMRWFKGSGRAFGLSV